MEQLSEMLVNKHEQWSTVSAQANDSAVETSTGGLKLRKEHSVLMDKKP